MELIVYSNNISGIVSWNIRAIILIETASPFLLTLTVFNNLP